MNIVDDIFESVKFKINPDEDYRKKYLFRFLKKFIVYLEKKSFFCLII